MSIDGLGQEFLALIMSRNPLANLTWSPTDIFLINSVSSTSLQQSHSGSLPKTIEYTFGIAVDKLTSKNV
jgi:hypothetical protein